MKLHGHVILWGTDSPSGFILCVRSLIAPLSPSLSPLPLSFMRSRGLDRYRSSLHLVSGKIKTSHIVVVFLKYAIFSRRRRVHLLLDLRQFQFLSRLSRRIRMWWVRPRVDGFLRSTVLPSSCNCRQ